MQGKQTQHAGWGWRENTSEDISTAQKQEATLRIPACKGGVVPHSPGPALRAFSVHLHPRAGRQVVTTREPRRVCGGVLTGTLEVQREGTAPERTRWRSAEDGNPRGEIHRSAVSRGLRRAEAACGWLASGHAQRAWAPPESPADGLGPGTCRPRATASFWCSEPGNWCPRTCGQPRHG